MIVTPTCQISNQPCNKFCISDDCQQSAFICRCCEQEQCLKEHQHEGKKISLVLWSKITPLIQKIDQESQNQKKFMTKVSRQINELIKDLKQLLITYPQRLRNCNKNIIYYNQEFKNTLNKIKERKFNWITGKQMRTMYNIMKADYHIKNQHQIEQLREKETQTLRSILEKIRQGIQQYNITQLDGQKIMRLNKEIKQCPQDSNNYYQRAVIYHKKNYFARALDDYTKVIQHDPQNAKAYNNRATIHYKFKQLQQSALDLTKGIELDATKSDLYYNRGIIYKNLNQLDKSRADFQKAIQLCPTNFKYYLQNGIVNQLLQFQNKSQENYLMSFMLAKKCEDSTLLLKTIYREANRASKQKQ